MDSTRVWWDKSEVIFVRWTDRSLVFAWCDATETAIQMPRGVVVRLLEKGVLHIEGVVPEWMDQAQRTRQQTPVFAPLKVAEPEPIPEPIPRVVAPVSAEPSPKLSVIARLIRKLGGSPDHKSSAHVAS